MIKKIIFLVSFFGLTSFMFAQENTSTTLDQQFENLIRKSNSYQEFKVVKKVKLNLLRKNSNDSLVALKRNIIVSNTTIEEQKNTINSLKEQLTISQSDLSVSKEKESGIEILGFLTKKTTYNLIMWSIIGVLLAFLLFTFYRFKNSNSITKSSKLKLLETEEELESHKKKALEQQQQLRRKLQDEINKNRTSNN